ncbi:hypothetical protein NV379_13410 [Paenibacillus sp. N1-5-1-14]|uniref:hypothetical protein n=1 Tax=Paenibacillus radicibacter TaxID=2972488 RepID=UPI0021594797|nr:hypothetical protein [Paenibacillus radicibacter]MCR8643649.1 hypothetical protein [Paenibacillus radicibacter]
MFAPKEYRVKKMLDYLEDKYGEKFVEEQFDPGNVLMPELYGGDSMLVYPTINRDIPFHVNKNVKSSGFNDNYVHASLCYLFTEKYKSGVESIDERVKAVKFRFGTKVYPEDPSILKQPIDDFANDKSNESDIHLYLVVSTDDVQEYKKDAKFIHDLHSFMLNLTHREFEISVAYIKQDKIQSAKDLIRISHTTNFSWDWLGDDVIHVIDIISDRTIRDVEYFEDLVRG